MELIDFTHCEKRKKGYQGANGNKISVIYNGELYMLKFPGLAKMNPNLSYANGCFSEYIGCHIFQSVGIQAQETLIGTFTQNGTQKIVVACKDFTTPGIVLQDFASLKNQIIDSQGNGYGTELADIEQTFNEQTSIDPFILEDYFWDMFIIDALIGNWDRHNGNWGFLYNTSTDEIEFAPIYDCGSSLYPQADEKIMEATLNIQREMDYRIYEVPQSAINKNGKRVNYYDFISSGENEKCTEALKRMLPKIDLDKVREIIESTPSITDLQKEFYYTVIRTRKEKILDEGLELSLDKKNNVIRRNRR